MPDYSGGLPGLLDTPRDATASEIRRMAGRIKDLEDENLWLRVDIAGPLRVALYDARLLLLALIDESDRSDDILAVIARVDDILDMCRTE